MYKKGHLCKYRVQMVNKFNILERNTIYVQARKNSDKNTSRIFFQAIDTNKTQVYN